MNKVQFNTQLANEYQQLFDTCNIRTERQPSVETILNKINLNQDRYRMLTGQTGIPWFLIAVIHQMESSLNFLAHLHNGDPLTARTFHDPAGRPISGEPPFTWEASASDALRSKGLHRISNWSIPRTLYELERYNGFGYRLGHPEVLSPYLWSFSSHYQAGKFIADRVFSASAVSKQCGGAVLLRRMAENGTIHFDEAGVPVIDETEDTGDLDSIQARVQYSTTEKSEAARMLQEMLNRFPGIFLKVDGIPGPRTSNALKKVTGSFLSGDPRG